MIYEGALKALTVVLEAITTMKTLELLADTPPAIPMASAWYIADIERAIGKQELFTRQSPQKLKVLKEHALIESAVSSNRIEGVEVDQSRIGTLVFGKTVLKDRDEEEVRGYRDALNLLHSRAHHLTLDEKLILDLHRRSRGQIWDAGRFKEKDGDIIQKNPDGTKASTIPGPTLVFSFS